MADENQEQAFKDLLVEIEEKRWVPLMKPDDIEDANELIIEAARNIDASMSTAITLFNVPGGKRIQQRKLKFIQAKHDFHTARYNSISTSDIRNLIPTYIPSNNKVYIKAQRSIESRNRTRCKYSLSWLYSQVKKIEKSIDGCMDKCGWESEKFFKQLTREQRLTVLGAIFDQYPLWLVTQFRQPEAKSVDFKQIWSPVDSPDRVALRSYYRMMFVAMANATYEIRVLGVLGGDMEELKTAWEEFPISAEVAALNLGGPEFFPMA